MCIYFFLEFWFKSSQGGDGTCTPATTRNSDSDNQAANMLSTRKGASFLYILCGGITHILLGKKVVNDDVGRPSKQTPAKTAQGSQMLESETEKCCLHCGKTELNGKKVRLHACECGKVFHHICAGRVGHDEYSKCFDCAVPQDVSGQSSATGMGPNLEKALEGLSAAQKNLMKLSSELELSGQRDSRSKADAFGKGCATAKECVLAAWQAWSQSRSPTKDKTIRLKELIGEVLKGVSGSPHAAEINFIWKKFDGNFFF